MTIELMTAEMQLQVAEGFLEDMGRGSVRFNPEDLKALGMSAAHFKAALRELRENEEVR